MTAPITSIRFNPESEDSIQIQKQEDNPVGQITPVAGPESPPPIRFDVELIVEDNKKELIDARFKDGDEAQLVIGTVGSEDSLSFPGRRNDTLEAEEEDYNVIFSVEDKDAEAMLTEKFGV